MALFVLEVTSLMLQRLCNNVCTWKQDLIKKGSALNKIIRYDIDLNNLPSLTDQQKAELRALSKMPDSEIDTSDIAPLDELFWRNAVHNPFYKPTKTSTTMRLDSDVLAWLKSQGKGYQTRMNDILREAMIRSLHHKA